LRSGREAFAVFSVEVLKLQALIIVDAPNLEHLLGEVMIMIHTSY
jgi:hypothetical protein